MDDHQLWKRPWISENRLMARVSVDDAAQADKIFDMLMGRPHLQNFDRDSGNQ